MYLSEIFLLLRWESSLLLFQPEFLFQLLKHSLLYFELDLTCIWLTLSLFTSAGAGDFSATSACAFVIGAMINRCK